MKVPAWLFGLSVLLSLGAVVAVVSVTREVRHLRQEVAQLREDRPAARGPAQPEREVKSQPDLPPEPAPRPAADHPPEPDKNGPVGTTDAPVPDLKNKVRETMKEIQKEDAQRWREQKARWSADARARKVAKVAEELALSAYQQAELLKILTELEEQTDEIWIEAKTSDNPDIPAAKRQVEALEEEANRRILSFLSPVQFEQWIALRPRGQRGEKD